MRKSIGRLLIKTAYNVTKPLLYALPGGRSLASNLYNAMTMESEKWLEVHGYPILVNVQDYGLGTLLYLKAIYAPAREARIATLVKEGDTVIDVGANIGYFTLFLRSLVGASGKVYAFEPDPRNFNLLKKTVEHNGWTNVVAEQMAVANRNGKLTLYQGREWTGNSLTPNNFVERTEVRVTTLDNYLPNIENVSLIKMDTDGSEPLAIDGSKGIISRSPTITVIAEYEPGNVKRYMRKPYEKYVRVIQEAGLTVHEIYHVDGVYVLTYAGLANMQDDDAVDLVMGRKVDD